MNRPNPDQAFRMASETFHRQLAAHARQFRKTSPQFDGLRDSERKDHVGTSQQPDPVDGRRGPHCVDVQDRELKPTSLKQHQSQPVSRGPERSHRLRRQSLRDFNPIRLAHADSFLRTPPNCAFSRRSVQRLRSTGRADSTLISGTEPFSASPLSHIGTPKIMIL